MQRYRRHARTAGFELSFGQRWHYASPSTSGKLRQTLFPANEPAKVRSARFRPSGEPLGIRWDEATPPIAHGDRNSQLFWRMDKRSERFG